MTDNFDELEMEFDFTDVEKMEDVGKFHGIRLGKYHVQVEKVEAGVYSTGKPTIKVKFCILAGTNPKMKGKVHIQDLLIDKSDFANGRLAQFAYCSGLLKPEHAGTKAKTNWKSLEGRHLVIEIIERMIPSKDGTGMTSRSEVKPGGVWSYLDPLVADVPKDIQAIINDGLPPPLFPSPGEATQPAASTPAASAPAKEWEDV